MATPTSARAPARPTTPEPACCPVCLDAFAGAQRVRWCANAHFICVTCASRLEFACCPLCRADKAAPERAAKRPATPLPAPTSRRRLVFA
jgi:hypothetical protein